MVKNLELKLSTIDQIIKNTNVYLCRFSKKQRKWESLGYQMFGEILKHIKRLITKKKLKENSCSRWGSQKALRYNRCHGVD